MFGMTWNTPACSQVVLAGGEGITRGVTLGGKDGQEREQEEERHFGWISSYWVSGFISPWLYCNSCTMNHGGSTSTLVIYVRTSVLTIFLFFSRNSYFQLV